MAEGLIQRWDYRWKIISLTVFIFSITYTKSAEAMICAFLLSVCLTVLTKIPLRNAVRSLKAPLLLLLFMSPFILFTPGENPAWQWHFLKIYKEGLILLYSITIKSVSIFIIFTSLILGSDMGRVMLALKAIGIPEKMILILISTYRYIHLYMADMGKLFRAARLRGFNLRKGFSHILTSSDIMLTLLIRSYEQSSRVHDAMVLRGYRGEIHKTEAFSTEWYDILLCIITVLCSAGIILMEIIC